MFLLSRPPVLRWVAAVMLVMVALWADLRPTHTVEHPFARIDLPVGTEVGPADVDMIDVPDGLLPPVELPMVVQRTVAAGDPLLASSAAEDSVVAPPGWLLVELAVPAGAHAGSRVVAVISHFDAPDPESVEGLVVTTAIDDGFGTAVASCAFPADRAGMVAVAAAENRISVLIGS